MSRRKKRSQLTPTTPQAQAAAIERFRPLLDPASYAALLAELLTPLYPALRTNPLKSKPDDIQDWSQRYGWTIAPVPFCPTGWWVTASASPISQTLEHHMGHYYIQDAASMLPAELFDLTLDDRPLILDMAASPGGKTTHLVGRTHDRGLVIANDAGLERTIALRLVLQTWGAINVAATRFPGEKFGRWFPETFDRVLLDAPCSMQSLRSTESHPMRAISAREQNALARRQTNLLISALAAVKTGGQVVYSTCTLAPEEDEAVLDDLLRRYPAVLKIESLVDRLPAPAPGLPAAFGREFSPDVQNAARLWPHILHTSGFFAALITKTGQISLPIEPPPSRQLELVGQEALSAQESRKFIQEFLSRYGFDLCEIIELQDLLLWRSPGAVYAVPRAFLELFADLPCQLMGLKIAEGSVNEWIPSHEWVARFGKEFLTGRLDLPADQLDPWLRGLDVPCPPHESAPQGGVMVVFDLLGRCVGRGKVQVGILKNLLPRRIV